MKVTREEFARSWRMICQKALPRLFSLGDIGELLRHVVETMLKEGCQIGWYCQLAGQKHVARRNCSFCSLTFAEFEAERS